ncbi:Dual specificity protein kinase lkh1 [Wickerhamiella sorbophila]|uniref:Dual specificity protein kinase lkh1 n=1 Tax=Wickerhamiella sorbophila TaxID=45607 RepID=A0A2T0FKG9_9ASCO|nr:Dual specificity protein kinase lkh1 [Wickerhamiella sorbophila]PRT55486.1 Dual specificity protein kinase lkh1 [Wickerhamiella sorbophila]
MPVSKSARPVDVPGSVPTQYKRAPPLGFLPNSPPNDANDAQGLSFRSKQPYPDYQNFPLGNRSPPLSHPSSNGGFAPNNARLGAGEPANGIIQGDAFALDDDDDEQIQFLGIRPAQGTDKRRRTQRQNNGPFNTKSHEDDLNNGIIPGLTDALVFPSPPLIPEKLQKPSDIFLRQVHDITPPQEPFDDDSGHYLVNVGEQFANRYVITRLLGQGTFGRVAEAYDKVTFRRYAIKIIRAIPRYRDASKVELRVLHMLSRYDGNNINRCIQLRECFDFRNHVCLVTDLLDISVYDFLRENRFNPFPEQHVLALARQLIKSVAYIHRLGLVHTDLKPENILLHDSSYDTCTYRRSPRGSTRQRRVLRNISTTLIDFGSAIFDDEFHPTVVSTRHYRAPEIILGTGWSFPCDMWSVGCVLVELCTGAVLFQTRDNFEHLHLIEKALGRSFPPSVIRKAATTDQGELFVDSAKGKLYPLSDSKQIKAVHDQLTIRELLRKHIPMDSNTLFWNRLVDLVDRMLAIDPNERITAEEAIQHPWFC